MRMPASRSEPVQAGTLVRAGLARSDMLGLISRIRLLSRCDKLSNHRHMGLNEAAVPEWMPELPWKDAEDEH